MKRIFPVILTGIFVLVFWIFYPSPRLEVSQEEENIFLPGDIILTHGQSWASRVVYAIQGFQPAYSHAGIIWKEDGKVYVLHATPDGTPENGIRYDDINTFLALSDVDAYVVMRLKNEWELERKIYPEVIFYTQNAFPFDYKFDNYTNDKIYCTELIYCVFSQAGLWKSPVRLSKPIFPSYFLQSSEWEEVARKGL